MTDPDDDKTDELPGLPAAGYLVTPAEVARLRGVGLVEISLYMLCLKGHTDDDDVVIEASYSRFAKVLAPRDSRAGGRRRPAPTREQVRDALERLEKAGLIVVNRLVGKDQQQLHVWLRFPGRVAP